MHAGPSRHEQSSSSQSVSVPVAGEIPTVMLDDSVSPPPSPTLPPANNGRGMSMYFACHCAYRQENFSTNCKYMRGIHVQVHVPASLSAECKLLRTPVTVHVQCIYLSTGRKHNVCVETSA